MIQYSITYLHNGSVAHLHRIPTDSLMSVITDIFDMNGIIVKIWLDHDSAIRPAKSNPADYKGFPTFGGTSYIEEAD